MDPLQLLVDEAPGDALPLPPELLAFHGGPLRMPRRPDRALVFANFVASIDGVVSVDPPRGNGADISGGNPQDQALMGVLRAAADAVVVSAGNLRAEGEHVWTAERIFPPLADAYAKLRAALGLTRPPLQVVVSGTGEVDLGRPVFTGAAPSLVVTTPDGAARLGAQGTRVAVAVPVAGPGWIPLAAVLRAAGLGPSARVLVESGPRSTTRYAAEGALDELFLTVAPILVGRAAAPPTLALVEGRVFAPGTLPARLLSARRGADFLFLRYGLRGPAAAQK